jgi:hypothetical protein
MSLNNPHWSNMTKEEWDNLELEHQEEMIHNHNREVMLKKRNKVSNAPVKTNPIFASQKNISDNTVMVSSHPVTTELPKTKLKGLRDWIEEVGGFSAERIRDCIIYQLDVKKNSWYIRNLTKNFIFQNVAKLDADTPPDYRYEVDPLFGSFTSGDQTHPKILRMPKNNEERMEIRNRHGVNNGTIPFLVQLNCSTCKGTGTYEISSYPNAKSNIIRLHEKVICDCVYGNSTDDGKSPPSL